MAIKYLIASDVESDPTRYKSRLLSIAHEMYILWLESMGAKWVVGNYHTFYANKLLQNKVDNGEKDETGDTEWAYLGEYALEIDDSHNTYDFMLQIHKNKLVTKADLINNGWNLT